MACCGISLRSLYKLANRPSPPSCAACHGLVWHIHALSWIWLCCNKQSLYERHISIKRLLLAKINLFVSLYDARLRWASVTACSLHAWNRRRRLRTQKKNERGRNGGGATRSTPVSPRTQLYCYRCALTAAILLCLAFHPAATRCRAAYAPHPLVGTRRGRSGGITARRSSRMADVSRARRQ